MRDMQNKDYKKRLVGGFHCKCCFTPDERKTYRKRLIRHKLKAELKRKYL